MTETITEVEVVAGMGDEETQPNVPIAEDGGLKTGYMSDHELMYRIASFASAGVISVLEDGEKTHPHRQLYDCLIQDDHSEHALYHALAAHRRSHPDLTREDFHRLVDLFYAKETEEDHCQHLAARAAIMVYNQIVGMKGQYREPDTSTLPSPDTVSVPDASDDLRELAGSMI